MPYIRKSCWAAALYIALVGGTTLADKQVVTLIGDADYPPYSYTGPDGSALGIYVDLLHKISAAMPNYVIDLQMAPWKRALKYIEFGEHIGIYPPYKRLIERPYMQYSLPLLAETVVLVCSNKILQSHKGAAWPAGFSGLNFGNNSGFVILGKPFFEMVKAGQLVLDEAKTTEANLLKLLNGRIDCYANDRRAIESEAKRLKLDLKNIGEIAVLGKELGYIGYARENTRFPYLDDFMKEFDNTVLKLRAAGQIPIPE